MRQVLLQKLSPLVGGIFDSRYRKWFLPDILLYMFQFVASLIFLGMLFCVSHFIFEPTYLYYEFKWLDIPMHILGGIGVTFLTASSIRFGKHKVTYLHLFLIYLGIACMWEVSEYLRGVMVYRDIYDYLDTVKDLFDGFVGMNIAYFFIKKVKN